MDRSTRIRTALTWTAGALGVAAGVYASYVGVTWLRYGHRRARLMTRSTRCLTSSCLPTTSWNDITFTSPRQPTSRSPSRAKWICKGRRSCEPSSEREVILGATPDDWPRPRGLLAETQSLGWGILADVPERQVVVGAVTKPWEANVTFRALPPSQFVAFDEPGHVKIAWTIRADPISGTESVFRTETRAMATDADARTRFRRYWSFLSPGIIVIRWALLGPVKKGAERRARETDHATQSALRHHTR